MIRRISALKFCTLMLLGCVHNGSDPDREIDAIFRTVTGKYAGEARKALAQDGEMEPIFHKFAPIDAPQFGKRVIYYQLSSESADGAALQAKIFVFDTDSGRVANSMRAFIIGKGQVPDNLEQHPEIWPQIEPESLMSFPPECRLTWSAIDGGFQAVGASNCAYQSRAFRQVVRPSLRYAVVADRLEWSEQLLAEQGQVIATTDGPLVAYRE